MPEFGIFSDIVAVRDKTPHIKLSQAYMTNDSQWCYYDMNGVERMPGRSPEMASVQATDENPILRYHFHRATNGSVYCFIFTKAHVYVWDSVNEEMDLMFTCASDCEYWSTVSINGKVIVTNFVDKVQVWSDATPGTAFTAFGSASGVDTGSGVYLTKAKFVTVYENYLHFMYTEEGGVTYTGRDRWSSRGVETDFDTTGSGDTGARDFTDGLWITGHGAYSASSTNLMVIFTNKTIETQWLVSDDLVFEWQTHLYNLGCLAPDSVVNDKEGNLYFLGTDKTIHKLFSEQRYSADIDTTVRSIHPTLNYYVRGYYVESINRIWWSIPKDGESTQNDRVISLNLNLLAWDPFMDIGISAFGEYSQQKTYTIDEIPFDTIDSIGWETIDGLENVSGTTLDICGSYDGYTYKILGNTALDAGSAYTSEVVMGTDLSGSQALSEYKRFNGFWAWFKRFPGVSYEVTVAVKTGEDSDYTTIATIDISTGNNDIIRKWCPCDVRGRDFLIKTSATNDFILYGYKFPFTWDGDS